MTLNSFNVWGIYQINTLEHSLLSVLSLCLESNEFKQNLSEFDIYALRCNNKRQLESSHWLSHHRFWANIPWFTNMVSMRAIFWGVII